MLALNTALDSFRPLTGISLFLSNAPEIPTPLAVEFSSPHGDFSFSINIINTITKEEEKFSSPHGDFSFSIGNIKISRHEFLGFRPLTGISLFLFDDISFCTINGVNGFRPLTGISLFLSEK